MNFPRKEFKKCFEKFANIIPSRQGDIQKYLSIEYATGGSDGGNCWNDDEPKEYRNDVDRTKQIPNHFFEFLENHFTKENVEIVRSNLSRFNFFYDNWTRHEYYGNYKIYEIKYISSNVLYDFLVELEIIDED